MHSTPSVALPADADSGVPARPPMPLLIGSQTFTWGERTYLMGIVNVTPDSFSGDGLMSGGASAVASVERAIAQARAMVEEGADVIDVGGQSTRPGHGEIPLEDEVQRVEPVVREIRAALPNVTISIDTTRAAVAEKAVAAGADLLNDIWGVAADEALLRFAGESGLPIVLMHNRQQPRYANVVAEVVADLVRAVDSAVAAGVAWESTIVDPGIGFGKTAEQNLAVLHDLAALSVLGRPILLGTSRKSTIGKVLDLPADQRVEGTIATTALAIAAGADIIRVHDMRPNARAARMTDAVVRGGWKEAPLP
ncbi:MAG TPA: dihydropteroate synthase [Candidatus Limnocylindrales bacterium]